MTCSGEVRSPLEASVQELCNARLVEVMCTWTKASLQIPPANFAYGLLPSGPPLTLIRRPRSWRSQTNSSPMRGKVVPDKSNLAETICPMDLRSPSITGTRRKSGKDFSLRYAQWESRWLNSPPRRQSPLSREQSREAAHFSIPAALHVLGCLRPNGIAQPGRCDHVRYSKTA